MDQKELYKKIGLRIKELRTQREMTQLDISALCNFEKTNLSRIEAGRVNSTVNTLNKIATALEVPLHQLFLFSDEV